VGILPLAAEKGEEHLFQSSTGMPMNDGERGEETSLSKLSGILNDMLMLSRGLRGSERGSHAKDEAAGLWLSKENVLRSKGVDCEENGY